MSTHAKRAALVRRVLMAAWGMATFVLLFCVVLLVYSMVSQGQDPLGPVRDKPIAPPPPVTAVTETTPTQEVTLYFTDLAGRSLAPETRVLEHGNSTVENCRAILNALIEGPRGALHPLLPANTVLRSLYMLKGGELVVDFSIQLELEMRKRKSASLEALMVYGIVNTLTQPGVKGADEPAVSTVRLLIEGSAPRESFPAHVDLSGPVAPDASWFAGPREQTPNAG
ncbi:MAG: hypothetical protein GWP08_02745 [Nitrospiraceae bacterium]|nr:hypothetical protein [Nitrospiraceae bacterium]